MKCMYSKQAYATEGLAETALNFAILNNKKGRKTPIRYFLCPDCGRYHLTSQPERRPHAEPSAPETNA